MDKKDGIDEKDETGEYWIKRKMNVIVGVCY
jgi:hypothetical protein